jgi:hypothetical protein
MMSGERLGLGIVAAALSTIAALVGAPAAHACWDGSMAVVGRVTYTTFDDSWSADDALQQARWLSRIDRLLPEGASLEVWPDPWLTVGGDTIELEFNGTLSDLYHQTARALRVNPLHELMVRHAPGPTVWTVQAGSFASEAQALRQAETIGSSCASGFYEAGGFPAMNPTAHVERESDGRFRVVVGAFLERAEAGEVVACLASGEPEYEGEAPLSIKSFVRRLERPTFIAAAD